MNNLAMPVLTTGHALRNMPTVRPSSLGALISFMCHLTRRTSSAVTFASSDALPQTSRQYGLAYVSTKTSSKSSAVSLGSLVYLPLARLSVHDGSVFFDPSLSYRKERLHVSTFAFVQNVCHVCLLACLTIFRNTFLARWYLPESCTLRFCFRLAKRRLWRDATTFLFHHGGLESLALPLFFQESRFLSP